MHLATRHSEQSEACPARGSSSRRARPSVWPVRALIAALVLLPTSTLALAGDFKPGPDSPEVAYWFRNLQGPGPQAGDMDPRLQEAGDAFGSGDYQRARELAQALLEATDDADLRAEATSFLVESYVVEGNFDSARAAGQRINDAESLARINRIEAEYKAKVGRLQHIIDTCSQPGAVARARRDLARARLEAGEGHKAFEYYYERIAEEPNSRRAERAVRVISELTAGCFGCDAAAELLRYLRDQYPSSSVAAMADYELAQIAAAGGLTLGNAEAYLAVIQQYPSTEAGRLAASALREGAPGLLAELVELHSWGRHRAVIAHFADLACYFDSLDPTSFGRALEILCSSAGYFSLAEEAGSTVGALLGAPRSRGDPAKMALLYEAQGALALRSGDTDAAVQAWQRLLEGYPASGSAARAAVKLGDYYLAAGKREEAIRAYHHARGAMEHLSGEERAWAMVGVGRALESLERIEEAAFEYRAAAALAPGSSAAYEAWEALERLGVWGEE